MSAKKLIEINATEDVSRPADFALTNGVPAEGYVSNLFTRGDTSEEIENAKLAGAIRYLRGTAVSSAAVTLVDRKSNYVTVDANDVAITLPGARTDGTLRDFILRIEMAQGTTHTPTIPALSSWEGDALPTFAAGKSYLMTFTETKADVWYIKAFEITTQSAT